MISRPITPLFMCYELKALASRMALVIASFANEIYVKVINLA